MLAARFLERGASTGLASKADARRQNSALENWWPNDLGRRKIGMVRLDEKGPAAAGIFAEPEMATEACPKKCRPESKL